MANNDAQNESNNAFGELVRMYRKRFNYSQDQLREAMDLKTIKSISNWEIGEHSISSDNLKKLIEVFLREGAFKEGQERQNAQELWRASGNGKFDADWFAELLNPPVASMTELSPQPTIPAAPEPVLEQAIAAEIKGDTISETPTIESTGMTTFIADEPEPHNEVISVIEPEIEGSQNNLVLATLKSEPSYKKSRRWLWVGVAAILVIIAGVVVLVFELINSNKPQAERGTLTKLLTINPTNAIVSISYSRNGKYLAVAAVQPFLQIWKLDTDISRSQLVEELPSEPGQYFSNVYRNFGVKALASISSGNKFKVWPLNSDGLPQITPSLNLTPTTSYLHVLSLSPDNQILATSGYSNRIDLWDIKSEQLLKHLPNQNSTIEVIAFSPTDANLLASAGFDKLVKIWDLQTGTGQSLVGHRYVILRLAFSSDGRLLASADDNGTIIIWDVATRQKLQEIATNNINRKITALAFSPDGKWLASGGSEKILKVWDVATGALLKSTPTNTTITSLDFNPTSNEKILAFGTDAPDGAIWVWKLDN